MKYDLGKESMSAGCCSAPTPCDSGKKVYYPSLYLSGKDKIVITFRKVASGEDRREDEEPQYRCELEIRSIEPKGGMKKDDGMASVGDALKSAMRKKMKKGEYEEEE